MKKIIYAAVFYDADELRRHAERIAAGTDGMDPVPDPHTTLAFRPDASVVEVLRRHLGTEVRAVFTGWGCDGLNAGFLAELSWPDGTGPTVSEAYRVQSGVPHCTYKLSPGARAKDTAGLAFEPLDRSDRFILTGRLGFYTPGGVLFDPLCQI